MRARVQGPRLVPLLRVRFDRTNVPEIAWNGVGAEAAKAVGDLLGIAERSKEGLYTCGRKCGKEILQVQAHQHVLAGVRRGKAYDRASFDKSVHGRVSRNAIENTGENPSLQFLEAWFRTFRQADAAGAFE